MPQINTGQQEKRQKDVNPASPTFGQFRWVPAGMNLDACPVPQQIGSVAISETVYRNDCTSGVSTAVVYAIPAGMFKGTSQSEADAKAREYFNANKQAYAQANATCVTKSVRVSSFVTIGAKTTNVTVTRTDTLGDLLVVVQAAVIQDGPDGPEQADRTASITIPDGQTTASQTVGFGPGPTVQLVDAFIESTQPGDYTIQ